MIEKINGTDFSNLYRLSLPKALAFICLRVNQLITISNDKIIKLEIEYETKPNIRLSKDQWL